MNNPAVMVPLAVFLFLAAIIVVPIWLRHKSQLAAIRMIGETAAKGQAVDPNLIQMLMAKPKPAVGKWFAILNLLLGVPAFCTGIALFISVTQNYGALGAND